MSLFEESGDSGGVVAVETFESGGREGHGEDAWGDVGEVEIVSVLDVAIFGAAYDLSQALHARVVIIK